MKFITMRKIKKSISFFCLLTTVFLIVFLFQSCKQEVKTTEKGVSLITVDSIEISSFFETYPEMKNYEKAYQEIYEHYDFHYIWFTEEEMLSHGKSLYQKAKDLKKEGVFTVFPYQKEVDEIYEESLNDIDAEFLMTGLYVFYMDHVYKGYDSDIIKDMGWLLPKKELNHTALLDSVLSDDEWDENDSLMISQYYDMRKELHKYQEIEKEGGWEKIEFVDEKNLKPEDSSAVILQVRKRLYLTGELENDNEKNIYDEELKKGIYKFQKSHGFNQDAVISKKHLTALSVPVEDYIEKIALNMERLRWIPTQINDAKEFIFVNIPAYDLAYYRDGEIILSSDVVVGDVMTKTVIFAGEMSYLAFSPYWNIPKSIIEKEVKPGMEKDENYLEKRNMEWNDGQVRQKPGKTNSLGLVKFMFPNENNIYLHDTPAKNLFDQENRALSHGCIRVEKARDLAISIMEENKDWTPEKVDSAMNAGKEHIYDLKNEIPVYIGYFTAWVDEEGETNFYEDIYKRDNKLAKLLFNK